MHNPYAPPPLPDDELSADKPAGPPFPAQNNIGKVVVALWMLIVILWVLIFLPLLFFD